MNKLVISSLILVALLTTACGRRLPEPTAPVDSSSTTAEIDEETETAAETTESEDDIEVTDAIIAESETEDDAEGTDAEETDGDTSDDAEMTEDTEVDDADSETTLEVTGDPEAGAALFVNVPGNAPCSSCHIVDSEQMLVGPGMAGLGSRAGERTSASAADYLHESILNPNAHVVEGYPAGVMPQNYADSLTEDQINDLVAYMLSL